jgi:putative radical SAM enzyme (TIGR03279 family)
MTQGAAPGIVSGTRPGSLAEAAGIGPGDAILSVGGRALRDVVDLQFYQAEAEVEVHVRKADGREELFVFEKDIDEDLGLEFDRATWDDVILCNNNCFFCFLKGLPKGMRRTLYMKDDDYRLSFLHGNFVTLTNLAEDDWARLEEQRLSPLNVSVHATEPELRRQMLGNPKAPDVLEVLRRLSGLGIRAHTQIVLCPGVNDGSHLERSVRDLATLYPAVQTISVVPVGASPKLEDWSLQRDGIELVRPSAEYAQGVIRQMRPLQRELRKRHGATIVQCSDEYYITAGERVPAAHLYDGYPQYENGIGMVRRMLQDWHTARRKLPAAAPPGAARRKAVVACGALIAPLLSEIASEMGRLTGSSIEVVAVPNTVFGERVNVSGLLCGQDFVRALAGRGADVYILPRPSLDYFGQKFLDDLTIEEVEGRLGVPLTFATLWSEVVEILAHGPQRPGRGSASNGAFWSEDRATLPAGAAWEAVDLVEARA